MSIETFSQEIVEKISDIIGNQYLIQKNEVTKTNDVKLKAISLVEKGMNYGPTIYLNQYYEEYVNQRKNISEIVQEIITIADENKTNMCVMEAGNLFQDYEKVKDMMYLKILNKEMNQNVICNSPFEELLDLIIVPYIMLPNSNDSSCTITVTNKMVDLWGKTDKEVIEEAKFNMSIRDYSFRDMSSVVSDMLFENNIGSEENIIECINNENEMYVVSSKNKCNGAYFGFEPTVLSKISKVLGDEKRFIILPSSIHEVIILNSDINNMNLSDLKKMVKEVNRTEVEHQEILSDNVYYYNPDDLSIKIA